MNDKSLRFSLTVLFVIQGLVIVFSIVCMYLSVILYHILFTYHAYKYSCNGIKYYLYKSTFS